MTEDCYRVIGGEPREGAIVVSQFDEAVDYSPMLSGRVANIVPVDSIDKVTAAVNAYTQTIGIYPESLKRSAARHVCRSSGHSVSPAWATRAVWRSPCPRMRSSRSGGCASGSSTRNAIPTW